MLKQCDNQIVIRIDDLYKVNQNLSNWHLFMRHWGYKTYLLLAISAILTFLLIGSGFYINSACLTLFGGLIEITGILYLHKKTQDTMRQKFPSVLKGQEKIKEQIQEIQIQVFKQYITHEKFYEISNLDALIAALAREQQMKQYRSFGIVKSFAIPSLIAIIVVFATGAIEHTKDFSEVVLIVKAIVGLILMMTALLYFIEFCIIREIILWTKMGRMRLVRVLENISLEQRMNKSA